MVRAQRAMALAMIAPDGEGRGKGKAKILRRPAARAQLGHLVIREEMGLDAAYKQALERKKAKECKEQSFRSRNSPTPRPQEGAGLDRLPAAGARADAGADRDRVQS